MVLAWLLFGAYVSTGGDGPTWLPPLLYAIFLSILLTNDIRFKRLAVEARQRKRLARHISKMAFALAIAMHAPIVSFSDELGLHPALAFFGPFSLWPAIIVYFKKTRGALAGKRRPAG